MITPYPVVLGGVSHVQAYVDHSIVTVLVFVTLPVEMAWGYPTMGWLHSRFTKALIDVSYILDLFSIFNTTYIDTNTQIEVWSRIEVAFFCFVATIVGMTSHSYR